MLVRALYPENRSQKMPYITRLSHLSVPSSRQTAVHGDAVSHPGASVAWGGGLLMDDHDLAVDFMDMTSDRRLWTRLQDARPGFVPIAEVAAPGAATPQSQARRVSGPPRRPPPPYWSV